MINIWIILLRLWKTDYGRHWQSPYPMEKRLGLSMNLEICIKDAVRCRKTD